MHDRLPAAQRRRIGPAGVGVVEREAADVPTVQMDEASVEGDATVFSACRALPDGDHVGLSNKLIDEPRGLGLVKYTAIVPRKRAPESPQCADVVGSIAELHLDDAKSLMPVNTF